MGLFASRSWRLIALAAVMIAAAACAASSAPEQPSAGDPAPAEAKAAPTEAPPPAKAAALPESTEPVEPPASAERPLADGRWYRASLDFGKKLPSLNFFLHLPDSEKDKATIVNGSERIEFGYKGSPDKFRLSADWNYESNIEAHREGAVLRGRWRRYTPLWGEVILPFVARPVDAPEAERRYDGPAAAAGATVDGYWQLDFKQHGYGRAHLSQEGAVVTGTMRPGNLSDIRFLAGNVRGRKVVLSTFNGNAANVVTAELSRDGKTLRGVMSMQNVWNEKFTGRRVDAMPPERPPHLQEGARKLTLPAQARIKGPTLVIFFATWCPSCNDAFPFLVDLARRFRPKGVEVIGLDYDLTEDEASNQRQLEHFREKYQVDFELVQVPTSLAEWVDTMPPELKDWDGLPVFAFIDADGVVKHLWGGWWGPAAPDENQDQRQQFETWMAELEPR